MNTTAMQFKQMLQEIQHIPDVNAGGCAIVALAMYRWLKQQGEQPFLIYAYIDCDEDSFDQNSRFLQESARAPSSCSHALLEWRNNYYESHGQRNEFDEYYKYYHRVSERLVVESLKIQSEWNPRFNRTYISLIETIIGASLNDVPKFK